ncbi:hypothetical protein AC579_1681 [Pseudocercospora musae]|uniref:Uncharacterized protein n=1 Tax=Pseudocercospora musae TaxID=113226 RepID=A0A139GT30_9PEZI|nr:hypothetical protein AC579_1681 [Pseudocercospora musae]
MSSPTEFSSPHRASHHSPSTSFDSGEGIGDGDGDRVKPQHHPTQPPLSPPTSISASHSSACDNIDDSHTDTFEIPRAAREVLGFLQQESQGRSESAHQEERSFDLTPSEFHTLSALLGLWDGERGNKSKKPTADDAQYNRTEYTALRSWAIDHLGWQYDAKRLKFTVRMPCAIHDTFANELGEVILRHLRVATKDVGLHVCRKARRLRPQPGDEDDDQDNQKYTTDRREPDFLISCVEEARPLLVVEIGYATPAHDTKCREYITDYTANAVLRANITYLTPRQRAARYPQDVTFDFWYDGPLEDGSYYVHRPMRQIRLSQIEALHIPTSWIHQDFAGCPDVSIPAEELKQALEFARRVQREEDGHSEPTQGPVQGRKRARQNFSDEGVVEGESQNTQESTSFSEPDNPHDADYKSGVSLFEAREIPVDSAGSPGRQVARSPGRQAATPIADDSCPTPWVEDLRSLHEHLSRSGISGRFAGRRSSMAESEPVFTRMATERIDGVTHTYCHTVLQRPVQHGEFKVVHKETMRHEIEEPGSLVDGESRHVQETAQQLAVRHEGMLVHLEWHTCYTQNSNFSSLLMNHGGTPTTHIPAMNDAPLATVQQVQAQVHRPVVGDGGGRGSSSALVRVYSATATDVPNRNPNPTPQNYNSSFTGPPPAPAPAPAPPPAPAPAPASAPAQPTVTLPAQSTNHRPDHCRPGPSRTHARDGYDSDDTAMTMGGADDVDPTPEGLQKLKHQYNEYKRRLHEANNLDGVCLSFPLDAIVSRGWSRFFHVHPSTTICRIEAGDRDACNGGDLGAEVVRMRMTPFIDHKSSPTMKEDSDLKQQAEEKSKEHLY